jgi:uncharacterized protein YicC (UPF0701 family)
MVDSRKGTAMADELGSISERVQVVERKLEQKIEQLAASVKSGFDGVDEAFADQRLYTELAVARVGSEIHRLDSTIDARFSRLERRIEQVIDLHLPKVPPGGAENG